MSDMAGLGPLGSYLAREEREEGRGPGIDVDTYLELKPIYDSLVNTFGASVIHEYMEKHGTYALHEFPQGTEHPIERPGQESGGDPSVDLDPNRDIKPIYHGLVSAYGKSVIDKYVEKHGPSALLEFPQTTEHPIDRLARGLIPEAPHRLVVIDALAAASEEAVSPAEVNQKRVGQMPSDRAADQYRKGMISMRSRPDEAVLCLLESWEAALESKDRLFMARSSQELADMADALGQRAEAFRWYMLCLWVYSNLASESRERGDYGAAQRHCDELVEVANRMAITTGVFENPLWTLKTHWIIANHLWESAEVASLQGDEEKARKQLEDGAETLVRAVEVARQGGMEREFLDAFSNLLPIFERLEDKNGQAYALHGLGRKALFEGKPDEARKLFERALKISEELIDQRDVADNLLYMGIIAFYEAEFKEAHDLLMRSLDTSEKAAAMDGFAESLLWLANIAFEQDDLDKGRSFLKQSVRAYEQVGAATAVSRLGEFAKLARDLGKQDTAQRLDERGLQITQLMRPSYSRLSK